MYVCNWDMAQNPMWPEPIFNKHLSRKTVPSGPHWQNDAYLFLLLSLGVTAFINFPVLQKASCLLQDWGAMQSCPVVFVVPSRYQIIAQTYTHILWGVNWHLAKGFVHLLYTWQQRKLEQNGNFMALKIESVTSKKCLPLHFPLLLERWNSSQQKPEECGDTSHQTWWSLLWSSTTHTELKYTEQLN